MYNLITYPKRVVIAQKNNLRKRQRKSKDEPQGQDSPWLFRSYDHIPSKDGLLGEPLNKGFASDDLKVWEVARATTAAPTYFPVMYIGQDAFMDGGVGANNPTTLAMTNARQITRTREHKVSILVSIGTGKLEEPSRFGHVPVLGHMPALFKLAKKNLTATEPVHENTQRIIQNQSPERTYYVRFNEDRQLGHMPLNDWRVKNNGRLIRRAWNALRSSRSNATVNPDTQNSRLTLVDRRATQPVLNEDCVYKTVDRIESCTRDYLTRAPRENVEETQHHVRACAERLVAKARERRSADPDRWAYFTGDEAERRTAKARLNYEER